MLGSDLILVGFKESAWPSVAKALPFFSFCCILVKAGGGYVAGSLVMTPQTVGGLSSPQHWANPDVSPAWSVCHRQGGVHQVMSKLAKSWVVLAAELPTSVVSAYPTGRPRETVTEP